MFDGHVYVVEDVGNHGKILNKLTLVTPAWQHRQLHRKILIQAKNKLYCFEILSAPSLSVPQSPSTVTKLEKSNPYK